MEYRSDHSFHWIFKQLDHICGLSFNSSFDFALAALLLKGLYDLFVYFVSTLELKWSAKLLTFKRETFVYHWTKNSHSSMCPFRGCGFTYGKKNITSPCIHFESLWDCGVNRPKYSGDNLNCYYLELLNFLKRCCRKSFLYYFKISESDTELI